MKNEVLAEYFNILCQNNYPDFINKYLKTKEMQRISYIGQFCGSDYTAIYSPLFFYSRYDHSIATALMTWHFTKDKTQTLCALFHDLGTPCFSHCIDYLLGDFEKQESSEKDVFSIISNSQEMIQYLEEDDIKLEDLKDIKQYSIVENEKPKLCVDRLDGVLHTVLIWIHTHSIEQIKEVYKDIAVLKDRNGYLELGFNHKENANLFFDMIYEYSIELQSNENKFTTQFIADCIKILIEQNKISIEDLYNQKEEDIVKLLENDISGWKKFEQTTQILRSDIKPNYYFVSVSAKKRYVIPLCIEQNEPKRLDEISEICKELLEEYFNYKDTKYAYIPGIILNKEN